MDSEVQDVVTVQCIPTAMIMNPARVEPKSLVSKVQGSGATICVKGAGAGEAADLIFFGFVISSNVVDGRTYKNSQGQTKVLKELEVMLIQQEAERGFACLSMVLDNKILTCPITDEGALSFSTKHSTIDEDGNPDKKSVYQVIFLETVHDR